MTNALIAALVLGGLGIFFGLLLAISSKVFYVKVDEREEKVASCLNGANCGGCGYAGCDGYANALVDGSEEKINKCVAGGAAVVEALAKATGKEAEAVEEKVAYVHCKGDCEATQKKAEYNGTKTCKASKLLFGGEGTCTFGCLGYGDCAAVCPEQAINVINGVAHVNGARCIACGQCVSVCPQKIVTLIPKAAAVKVTCSNKEKGPVVMKKCTAGCIGCGLCMRNCPAEAIKVEGFLATIDYEKCIGCGKCREVCPKKCIL
jgi:RnfABCDGE-type electron transport complex B subunit